MLDAKLCIYKQFIFNSFFPIQTKTLFSIVQETMPPIRQTCGEGQISKSPVFLHEGHTVSGAVLLMDFLDL